MTKATCKPPRLEKRATDKGTVFQLTKTGTRIKIYFSEEELSLLHQQISYHLKDN